MHLKLAMQWLGNHHLLCSHHQYREVKKEDLYVTDRRIVQNYDSSDFVQQY